MPAHTAIAANLLFAMALVGCATYPAPDLVRLSQARAAELQASLDPAARGT